MAECKTRTVTPLSDKALQEDWPLFVATLRQRLKDGKSNYGDTSFTCELQRLTKEISQECLDQSGWAFILWQRVQALEKEVIKLLEIKASIKLNSYSVIARAVEEALTPVAIERFFKHYPKCPTEDQINIFAEKAVDSVMLALTEIFEFE